MAIRVEKVENKLYKSLTLEITETCWVFNWKKAFFGVNSVSPEIMLVSNMWCLYCLGRLAYWGGF